MPASPIGPVWTNRDKGQGQPFGRFHPLPQPSIKFPMTWNPAEGVDHEVRHWMKSKGWPVTRVNFDPGTDIYSWRHDVKGSDSPTVRITRRFLEAFPGFIVVHHLEELKVAQAIRSR